MGSRRTTFGKTQRERDKRAKAAAKRERRFASASGEGEDQPQEPAPPQGDQDAVLAALAALHERFADGEMELEEFEARRDELRARLNIT